MPGRWCVLRALAVVLLLSCLLARVSAARPAASLTSLPSDGTWQEHGILADQFLAAHYDSVGDRIVTLGDWDPGARSLALSGTPAWHGLRGLPQNLYPNYANTGWDEQTGDAYVFNSDLGVQSVWRVTPGADGIASAMPIVAAGTPPPPRPYGITRFDHATQRLFVFGDTGFSPYSSPDTLYILQLGPSPQWSSVVQPWPPMGQMSGGGIDIVPDAARHRLVLLGGSTDSVRTLSTDSPAGWVSSPTSHPSGHVPSGIVGAGNSMAVDPAGDCIMGLDYNGGVWALGLGDFAWRVLAPAGTAPDARQYAALVVDRARHRLLVEGGRKRSVLVSPSSELWSLSLDGTPAWTELVPEAVRPASRYHPCSAYDPLRNRMLVFGWSGAFGPDPLLDTWALDLAGEPMWSLLATSGTPPPSGPYASGYDATNDVLWFMGDNGGLQALSLTGATSEWTQMAEAGAPPPGRTSATVVYDSSRNRFLYIGGVSSTWLADVWELTLSGTPTWRQLSPGGEALPGRGRAMAAYDPSADRVILFAGIAPPDSFSTDVWSLDLSPGDGAWHKLALAPGPSWRESGVMAFEPARQRMLMFGGYGFTNQPYPADTFGPLSDTWALDLAGAPAWHQLSPQGDAVPTGRYEGASAFDPVHDRLVIAGGMLSTLIDTWTLSFGDVSTATELALAGREIASDHVTLMWAGASPAAEAHAYRRQGDAAWQLLATLTADGTGRITLVDRTVTPGARFEYRLGIGSGGSEQFVGSTIVDVPMLSLSLRAGMTADRRVQLSLQLPGPGAARLALFDVTGRRVWSRDVRMEAAGSRAVVVDDAGLEPGLLFSRLEWGGQTRRARLALIR